MLRTLSFLVLPAVWIFSAAHCAAENPEDVVRGESFTLGLRNAAPRPSRIYTGIIVNGNCPTATQPGKSGGLLRKAILRHCRTTASTTTFAVLTDEGGYWRLDETGNNQVIQQWSPTTTVVFDKANHKLVPRIMRAAVTGTVEGSRLKVESLGKF